MDQNSALPVTTNSRQKKMCCLKKKGRKPLFLYRINKLPGAAVIGIVRLLLLGYNNYLIDHAAGLPVSQSFKVQPEKNKFAGVTDRETTRR